MTKGFVILLLMQFWLSACKKESKQEASTQPPTSMVVLTRAWLEKIAKEDTSKSPYLKNPILWSQGVAIEQNGRKYVVVPAALKTVKGDTIRCGFRYLLLDTTGLEHCNMIELNEASPNFKLVDFNNQIKSYTGLFRRYNFVHGLEISYHLKKGQVVDSFNVIQNGMLRLPANNRTSAAGDVYLCYIYNCPQPLYFNKTLLTCDFAGNIEGSGPPTNKYAIVLDAEYNIIDMLPYYEGEPVVNNITLTGVTINGSTGHSDPVYFIDELGTVLQNPVYGGGSGGTSYPSPDPGVDYSWGQTIAHGYNFLNHINFDIQNPCILTAAQWATSTSSLNHVVSSFNQMFGGTNGWDVYITEVASLPDATTYAYTTASAANGAVYIYLNDQLLLHAAQEDVAATILHELLHGMFDARHLDYSDQLSWSEAFQHQLMASVYFTGMKQALQEIFPTINDDDANALVYEGLQGTLRMNALYYTNVTQYNDIVNRAHSYGVNGTNGSRCH